jgi:GxxExxY protein
MANGVRVYPELTGRILGAAVDVHRALGPGMLESTYRACLVHRLRAIGCGCAQEVPIGVTFDGLELPTAFRADLIVDDRVVVELKAVDMLLPVHRAQLYTYMRLARRPVGLLINFNVDRLVRGVRRMINPRALLPQALDLEPPGPAPSPTLP